MKDTRDLIGLMAVIGYAGADQPRRRAPSRPSRRAGAVVSPGWARRTSSASISFSIRGGSCAAIAGLCAR
jgi:hypothetical protein